MPLHNTLLQDFLFTDKLVLRVAAEKLDSIKVTDLHDVIHNPKLKEALFLASPTLTKTLETFDAHPERFSALEIRKLQRTVRKYLSRMSSRCTPFGLFAAVGAADWSEEGTNIELVTTGQISRNTRFDMDYLCGLAYHISLLPELSVLLKFFPNSSWYPVGDDIRYIEYSYQNNRRKYKISAVKANSYTLEILERAAQGISLAAIAKSLQKNYDVELTEAELFVAELVVNQLLVSELEPTVTGLPFLQQLMNTLTEKNNQSNPSITNLLQHLKVLDGQLLQLDNGLENDIEQYERIATSLQQFGLNYDLQKLFQCDLNISLKGRCLNSYM